MWQQLLCTRHSGAPQAGGRGGGALSVLQLSPAQRPLRVLPGSNSGHHLPCSSLGPAAWARGAHVPLPVGIHGLGLSRRVAAAEGPQEGQPGPGRTQGRTDKSCGREAVEVQGQDQPVSAQQEQGHSPSNSGSNMSFCSSTAMRLGTGSGPQPSTPGAWLREKLPLPALSQRQVNGVRILAGAGVILTTLLGLGALQGLMAPAADAATGSSAAATAAAAAAGGGGGGAHISMGALFLASLLPVLKVVMLCSVGAICALQGFLTVDGRRTLATLIFNILTPCLFLSKLSLSQGVADALRLWPLTVNMILTHVMGYCLGWLMVRIVRPPQELRKHLMLATMVGNTGNLPLVLVDSLGKDPGLPFLAGSATLGLQYVILGNFSAALIQMPLVDNMLRKKKAAEPAAAGAAGKGPGSAGGAGQSQGVGAPQSRQAAGAADGKNAPSSATADAAASGPAQAMPGGVGGGGSRAWGSTPDLQQGSSTLGPLGDASSGQVPGTPVESDPLWGSNPWETLPAGSVSTSAATGGGQAGQSLTGGSSVAYGNGSGLGDAAGLPSMIKPLLGSAGSQNDGGMSRSVITTAGASAAAASIPAAEPGEGEGMPLLGQPHAAGNRSSSGSGANSKGGQAGGSDLSSKDVSRAQDGSRGPEVSPAGYGTLRITIPGSGGAAGSGPDSRVSLPQLAWARVSRALGKVLPLLANMVNPPTVACVVALLVASWPPLQACLFSPTGSLRLVGEVSTMLGDMTIPCLMLVLGANLSRGPGTSKIPLRCITATVLCRLVILPLLGTALVMGPYKAGWLGDMHPMALIVMLVTHSAPTAIMVHSMATMHANREDDVAALLFWEYAASAVTLPLLMALFLALVK